MTNLQMIESLCGLVEEFAKLVRHMAWRLEELNAMNDCDRAEIGAAMAKYSEVLGMDGNQDKV